jgi:hypothetical protein
MVDRTYSLGICILLAVACGDDSIPVAETESVGATAGGDDRGGTTSGAESGGSSAAATGSSDDGADSTGGLIEIDCTDACTDTATDAGIAVCYSCRCKAAMDGYMPTVEELQCDQATPLTIFTADVSGPEPVLVPQTTDEPTCANPSLLYETCLTGSKLGQIQEGDITVKWICRDPLGPPSDVYNDVGVIMYNARNGASCWFDDVDTVTDDTNLPDLDLMESDADNLAGYLERFYFTNGDSCSTDCHDADPFIYSPYLGSAGWSQAQPHTLGPYTRVNLDDESLLPVNSTHLLSPEVTPCAMCHRVGSAAGCDFLGPDALGEYKGPAHEPAVVAAMAPGSPDWTLAYWMPVAPQPDTFADWTAAFGAAKDKYEECCQNPGVPTPACLWEPIPTE